MTKILRLPSREMSVDALASIPAIASAGAADDNGESVVAALEDWCAHIDFMFALGIMCCPDSPDAAAALLNACTLAEIDEAVRVLSVAPTPQTYIALCERIDPQQLIQQLLSHDRLVHWAAGMTVRRAVSLHRNAAGTASLNSIAREIEKFGSRSPSGSRRSKRAHVSGLGAQNFTRYVWPRYRPVAHLWAAWSIMLDSEVSQDDFPTWMQLFLGTAQWLAEQAFVVVAKHSGPNTHGLLDADDTWVIEVPRTPNGQPKHVRWNNDLGVHNPASYAA